MTICAVSAGFYYWFSGFHEAGCFLMICGFWVCGASLWKKEMMRLILFAMMWFMMFVLIAQMTGWKWLDSEFISIYLMYCFTAAALKLATWRLPLCLMNLIWRKMEQGGWGMLGLFLAAAYWLPQEALAWISGFPEGMERASLMGLILMMFFPILLIAPEVRLAKKRQGMMHRCS